MALLGQLYEKGIGNERDFAKAREWYEKAAAGGNEDAKRALLRLPASEAFAAKDYAKAATLQADLAQAAEKTEMEQNGKAGPGTASAQGNLSFYRIFVKDFEGALAAADKALFIQPDNLMPATNRAHALMFLGRARQARALYLKYKGQRIAEGGDLWEEAILKDFAEFEKASLTHPQMDEIRAAFSSAPEKK